MPVSERAGRVAAIAIRADRSAHMHDPDQAAPPPASTAERRAQDALREAVRSGYAEIATNESCCGGGSCCGPTTLSPEQVALAVGYAQNDLSQLPPGANLGLSCGNPTALASLREGEVVLDLGSGAGFDCFVAGPRVGARGRVIGVDMTPEMLARARRNLGSYARRSGLANVEFRLGEIEHLPVADAAIDVVMSNCVLNLSPDKPQVWREIARVLKPTGRVAVSDIVLLRPLPEAVRDDVEALIGCIAGAVLIEESRAMATAAGLVEFRAELEPGYVDAMTNAEDPLYRRILAALPPGTRLGDHVSSAKITARKR